MQNWSSYPLELMGGRNPRAPPEPKAGGRCADGGSVSSSRARVCRLYNGFNQGVLKLKLPGTTRRMRRGRWRSRPCPRTCTHTHSLSLSFTLSFSLSLSHTHTHSHTLPGGRGADGGNLDAAQGRDCLPAQEDVERLRGGTPHLLLCMQRF